jgi:hypothetical protein
MISAVAIPAVTATTRAAASAGGRSKVHGRPPFAASFQPAARTACRSMNSATSAGRNLTLAPRRTHASLRSLTEFWTVRRQVLSTAATSSVVKRTKSFAANSGRTDTLLCVDIRKKWNISAECQSFNHKTVPFPISLKVKTLRMNQLRR